MGNDGSLGPRLETALAAVETDEPGFGSAVAVARNGALVGAAWVGEAAPGRAWTKTTPVVTWSVSKGVAAMVVARLIQEGALDPDVPIRSYWPEFAGVSGARTTLADVMTHRAGLPWLPDRAGLPSFADPRSWSAVDAIDHALAELEPVPGLAGTVAYHALTYGWLVDASVRRATGAGLNAHLQRMSASPHGLLMSFGTRCADIRSRLAKPGVPKVAREQAAAADEAFADAENALRRSLSIPRGMTFADVLSTTQEQEFLAAETPAISLVSDAGSLARAYSLFAAGGTVGADALIGTAHRDRALAFRAGTDDDWVTGGARNLALGFVLNSPPSISLAPAVHAFGHPGLGGSLAWGEPESGLGFAYLTNAAIPDTQTDARARALSRVGWEAVHDV